MSVAMHNFSQSASLQARQLPAHTHLFHVCRHAQLQSVSITASTPVASAHTSIPCLSPCTTSVSQHHCKHASCQRTHIYSMSVAMHNFSQSASLQARQLP